MNKVFLVTSSFIFAALTLVHAEGQENPPGPTGPQADGPFHKVILDADQEVNGKRADTLKDPMELAVAADGRVFYAERSGIVKMWRPETKKTVVIGTLNVFSGLEDGLLGVTLDPRFTQNGWIYLYHSLPETGPDPKTKEKAGTNRLSRFTLVGDKLDMASEKRMMDVATQREQCCHAGGSVTFDSQGNLFLSTGDNTNPFESDGYSPSDERKGRSPWDAIKTKPGTP